MLYKGSTENRRTSFAQSERKYRLVHLLVLSRHGVHKAIPAHGMGGELEKGKREKKEGDGGWRGEG